MKTQVLVFLVLCVAVCLAESRRYMDKDLMRALFEREERPEIQKRIQCRCEGDAPDLSHMTGTVYFSCSGGDGSWSKCISTYTAVSDCCHQAGK